MGLDAQVSLLTAAMDLKLVQLVRAAMNDGQAVASAAGKLAASRALVAQPTDRFEPRPRIHPTPAFEPRVRYHPTPRFEPRTVFHPTKIAPADCPNTPPPPELLPKQPVALSPLQPPWRMPLPQTPLQSSPQVKVHLRRPDVIHKGSLLDYFI